MSITIAAPTPLNGHALRSPCAAPLFCGGGYDLAGRRGTSQVSVSAGSEVYTKYGQEPRAWRTSGAISGTGAVTSGMLSGLGRPGLWVSTVHLLTRVASHSWCNSDASVRRPSGVLWGFCDGSGFDCLRFLNFQAPRSDCYSDLASPCRVSPHWARFDRVWRN